ncbi:hypothetical protein, partial [Acinetobacter radioresistens]|uniref:hypothetical protein n=1 Tax=Acinetobacter radioresistens TaxID=40216 RepID=UPI000D0AE8A5
MRSKLIGLGFITGMCSITAFAEPPVQPGDTLESLSKVRINTTVNGQPGSLSEMMGNGQYRSSSQSAISDSNTLARDSSSTRSMGSTGSTTGINTNSRTTGVGTTGGMSGSMGTNSMGTYGGAAGPGAHNGNRSGTSSRSPPPPSPGYRNPAGPPTRPTPARVDTLTTPTGTPGAGRV